MSPAFRDEAGAIESVRTDAAEKDTAIEYVTNSLLHVLQYQSSA